MYIVSAQKHQFAFMQANRIDMTKGTIAIYKQSDSPNYKWVARLETEDNVFHSYGKSQEQALAKLGMAINKGQ